MGWPWVVGHLLASALEMPTCTKKPVMAAKTHKKQGQSGRELQIVGSGNDKQGMYVVVVRPHQDDDELWHKLRHTGPRWFCVHKGEECRVVFQDELGRQQSEPLRRLAHPLLEQAFA